MVKRFAAITAVAIVIGLSFGITCLLAWAVTSIWPSVSFWPIAIGAWALGAWLSKNP